MSAFPGSNNPIVYAQFNLQGRWRRTLIVAGTYGGLIGAGIWLTMLTSTNFHPRDLEGWVGGIAVLQILTLLIFGSFRVESAVRGDVSSRMLESHRLMPTPPLGAILGYLFGAPLQAILVAAMNFILGSICCSIAGFSLFNWALLNGVVFIFSLFVYSMIAQFSFIARGGFILLIILGGIGLRAVDGETQILPSVGLLLYPLLSRASVFAQLFSPGGTGSTDQGFGYLMGVGGQLIFTAIAIRVAMRRYLSPNIIGLSAALGLMMLATWVGLAFFAFGWSDKLDFSRRFSYTPNHEDLVAQTMMALVTSMLLAMFPIASAARASRLWHRTGNAGGVKSKPLTSEWAAAVIATAIICLLMIEIPLHNNLKQLGRLMTVVIVLNFLISVTCLFSWGYLLRRRAWIFAVIWVVLTWLVPVVVDGVYRAMTDNNTNDATMLTTLSAPGALALIWSNSESSVYAGIAVQIGLTSIPAGLLILTHMRRRRA